MKEFYNNSCNFNISVIIKKKDIRLTIIRFQCFIIDINRYDKSFFEKECEYQNFSHTLPFFIFIVIKICNKDITSTY